MISKLMGNPKAQEVFSAISGMGLAPGYLADKYLQAKLEDKTHVCLAIEVELRLMAQQRFNEIEVLDALSDMERHKSRRKMGARAPQMLQDIANAIEQDYAAGDFEHLPEGLIRFRIGSTKITCKNKPGALALVIAKYRRGLPRRSVKK
jgi:hypothetical protein